MLPVLDLGEQPLANSYPAADYQGVEVRFPLSVVFCSTCSLVQLAGTVDPTAMFDDYAYFSSYSDTMVAAMASLARRLTEQFRLEAQDLVVEVASNDGYLLKHYQSLGIDVLGIEPAANVAAVARAAGVPTLGEYFSSAVASGLRSAGRSAAVIHANNVMAHVPEINDFVAGISQLLDSHGTLVVETPYLGRFISDTEFDTIYHEHVFYYSLTAIDLLLRRHGMRVVDVEQLPIHGGSLRIFARHEGGAVVQPSVTDLLADEAAQGVRTPDYYADFARRVAHVKETTLELLHREHAAGRRIAAYGAAAKGTVLLNHFGIDSSLVDYVVDRSPHKQGRRMPGVGIPVRDPKVLCDELPDLVLLLAWNFADEILEQQSDYRGLGGRFLLPIPEPRIV